ncbi:MAG: NUDIX hydrolase [Candidatus Electrothrix sp. YB6]
MSLEKQIRLGSAVLIIDDNRILLGKRNKEPEFGKWVLPGGKIEFGETHEQAAIREAKEELGVDIEPQGLAGKGIYYIMGQNKQRIIVYNLARLTGGELHPSSDISEANFFSKNELLQIDITDIVKEVLLDTGWI